MAFFASAVAALVSAGPTAAQGDAPLVFDSTSWPPSASEDAEAGGDAPSVAEELESEAERWNDVTHDALRGDPDAAYALGRRFAAKQGPRARRRALEWLGRAADAGHADAMFHLSLVQARIAKEEAKEDLRRDATAVSSAPEWETWRTRARQTGSLEAFAWGCGRVFDDDLPLALRQAARIDCYLGRALSDPGSRAHAWFEAKWEAVPSSSLLPQQLEFRAALVPYAHLIPDDPVVLATRIRPAEHPRWRRGDVPLVPLVLDHSWTWETEDGAEIVERVARRLDRGDAAWFALERRSDAHAEPAETRLARVDDRGLHEPDAPIDVVEQIEAGDPLPSHLVFPFPAGAGSEVVVRRASGEIGVVRVLREGVVVQTPAGRFECMRYAYSVVDAEPGPEGRALPQTILDYAPGIGLVRTAGPAEETPSALVGYDLSTPIPASPR
jgi:hypothetical protein